MENEQQDKDDSVAGDHISQTDPIKQMWFNSVAMGIISGLITGASMSYFDQPVVGFGTFLFCYVLFISMNKTAATRGVAITIMLMVGFLIYYM